MSLPCVCLCIYLVWLGFFNACIIIQFGAPDNKHLIVTCNIGDIYFWRGGCGDRDKCIVHNLGPYIFLLVLVAMCSGIIATKHTFHILPLISFYT